MKTRLPLAAMCGVLALLLLALPACSSNEAKTQTGIGKSCLRDAECDTGLICAGENSCQTCTPCRQRSDCAGVEGSYCNQDRACCKVAQCSADFECQEPLYCLDDLCRELPCTAAASEVCSRPGHWCDGRRCALKGCETHEDCESGLCDLATYTCKSCEVDGECPQEGMVCTQGVCKFPVETDGDQDVVRKGCPEYKASCMIDTLTCFDHLNPPDSFSSCSLLTDEGGNTVGYSFIFPDSAVWRMYNSPTLAYEAVGENGFCYRIESDLATRENAYYTEEGVLLGRYRFVPDTSTLIITCPDGSREGYDTQELDGCDGYQGAGVYVPPPPGIEQCGQDR